MQDKVLGNTLMHHFGVRSCPCLLGGKETKWRHFIVIGHIDLVLRHLKSNKSWHMEVNPQTKTERQSKRKWVVTFLVAMITKKKKNYKMFT